MLSRGLKIARFAAGDLLWKLANVVVLAVAARVLPADKAGLVVLSQTASMILLSLGDLGFRSSGIRLISLAEASTRDVVRAVTLRRLLSVLLVGMPGALICAALLADDVVGFQGLVLLILAYLPYFFATEWALLALGRTGKVAAARGVYGALLIALALAAFWLNVELPYFALIIMVGYCSFAIVSWLFLKDLRGYRKRAQHSVNVQSELAWSSSVALAVSFALNTLFHSIEVLMAGAFLGELESANFAAPFRLIFSLYALGWILTQYFSPDFARMACKELTAVIPYLLIFSGYGVIVAVVTFLVAPWMTGVVFGDAFPGAGRVLQWLAPTVLLDAMVAFLGTVLVMQNQGVVSAITIGLACLVSAAVFMLFGELGIIAAVVAKYSAYLTLLFMQCMFMLRKPLISKK